MQITSSKTDLRTDCVGCRHRHRKVFRNLTESNRLAIFRKEVKRITPRKIKRITDILFHDIPDNSQDKDFDINSKWESNQNTDREHFVRNGVEFESRKREDTYNKSDPKDFPYAVGLIIFREDLSVAEEIDFCSGTLITDEWVLTAGHCLTPFPRAVWVYAGGTSLADLFEQGDIEVASLPSNSQLRRSTEFFTYYNEYQRRHDVGLVRLQEKFHITDTVNTVKLSHRPWTYRGYMKCVTTGFGSIYSSGKHKDDYTRKTQELEVKQPCLCAFAFGYVVDDPVASYFICAKPSQDVGICGGDSGGGLVCDGRVFGINSFIFQFEDINYCEYNWASVYFDEWFFPRSVTCGGKNTLSVFHAICPTLPWINRYVHLFSDDDISECRRLSSVGTAVPFSYRIVLFGILITFIII